MAYVCQYCKASFVKYSSLTAHQNGRTRDGIVSCGMLQYSDVSDGDGDTSDGVACASPAVIRNPYDINHGICRRHQDDCTLGPPLPLQNLGTCATRGYSGSVDYGALVSAFANYCKWLLKSRSKKFWTLFLSIRHMHNDQQRKILGVVMSLFETRGKWCKDKRAVRYLLGRKPFWPLVTYTYTCDLSAFQVPGLGRVQYSFLDPIFAWIIQARKLCKKYKLIFRYREARRGGEQTWGSSVSCGQVMRQVIIAGNLLRYVYKVSTSSNVLRYVYKVSKSGNVCRQMYQVFSLSQACERMKNMAVDPDAPACMRYGPMVVGASFDTGNLNKTSSACPFAVTVGNTDYGGMEAAATIMYMPHLEVVGANRDTERFRLARHHLYQEIVATVVSVIERTQRNGVVCFLPTGDNGEEQLWTLLPVVAAAQFDTKER